MTTRTSIRPRRYRLRPWLVRSLIPVGQTGSYVLYRSGRPVYAGRSDTDLRRRLLAHAASARADYFTYDVHHNPAMAYSAECLHFHLLDRPIDNVIHPAHPAGESGPCSYCAPAIEAGRLTQRTRAIAP
jgi:hypothetical protein